MAAYCFPTGKKKKRIKTKTESADPPIVGLLSRVNPALAARVMVGHLLD